MSRTTSFGPSVSIRPSNLARAVNVNTPAPAATPKTSTQRPPFTSYRDKICADRPNDPICKLINQTPAERTAKVRSEVKNMVKPVTSSIPTPPVTKPTPVAKPTADRMQEIRVKICNDSPELCEFVK